MNEHNMKMKDYCIKPYDVLFFRGNKSFYFGEWYSEGVFPPLPSTFQGFIRHKVLVDNNISPDDKEIKQHKIGDDDTMPMEITGPYLRDEEGKIYFQSPKDIFRGENKKYYSAMPAETPLQSDLGFSLYCPDLPKEGKLEKHKPLEYISLKEMIDYRTKLTDIEIQNKEIVGTEDRVLIGLDFEKLKGGNRVVKEGRFNVAAYNRLKNDYGFYCNVKLSDDLKILNGSLKFGSESHIVYVEELKEGNYLEEELKKNREELKDQIIKTKTLKIILLQPAIFENGWLPFDYEDKDNKKTCYVDGLQLELLFAFMDAPIKISGYSFYKNTKKSNTQQKDIRLKPIRNAVPAGSVYVFRINGDASDEQIKSFIDKFDNKKIENAPYSLMGFNHVIVGI
ncbi:MAG: hypothetical protein A7315_06310 [Candidatus Altiarchaeales archaeon WOR_SM1_79]|nr:MAG: hypothetical protein A7315_06310 [Candidatus Altiarchaeales archaeon WOR_SM1_79]